MRKVLLKVQVNRVKEVALKVRVNRVGEVAFTTSNSSSIKSAGQQSEVSSIYDIKQ